MKYKFLMNIFKVGVSSEDIPWDKLEVHSLAVYNYLIRLKINYESKIGRKFGILDRIMDELYLGGILNSKVKIDKKYKTLVKFLKTLTKEDCRVINSFRLYMYQEMNEIENVKDVMITACVPYFLFTTLAGGILYLPLEVNGKKISIWKELDKLHETGTSSPLYINDDDANLVLASKMSDGYSDPVMDKIKDKKKIKALVHNIINGAFTYFKGEIYLRYYEHLLGLFNALAIPEVNRVYSNYIDINFFKLNLGDMEFIMVDKDRRINFLHRGTLKDLYSRKYLVPKNGVLLKTKIKRDKAVTDYNYGVVAEGYDDVIGYYIYNLDIFDKKCDVSGFFLTTDTNSCAVVSPTVLSLFDFYGVNPEVFKDGKRGYLYGDLLLGRKILFNKNCEVERIIQRYKETDYEVLLPSYWKYRGQIIPNNDKTGEAENVLVTEMIKISAFKRNLAKGQHRSQKADALAKKLCIKLKEGETIVSPFERKQKVKL